MKSTLRFFLAAGLLAASSALAQPITIDTVFVGDAGNPNDSTGFGGVSYDYYIGTTEVTNGQYASFLNSVAATDPHGLWNSSMGTLDPGNFEFGGITRTGSDGSYSYAVISGRENYPVNYVSFWDSARFANWLSTGDTETGVYVLTADGIANNTITRDATAWANGGVAITSENEWYKAAYYSGSPTGADGDGYWLYPTQNNGVPSNDLINPDPGNNGNFYQGGFTDPANYLTQVGEFENSASYYGTFDQGGNLSERNDTIVMTSSARGLSGGSFYTNNTYLGSSLRVWDDPTFELEDIGFRVSSLAPIPEPSTYAAIVGGLGLLVAMVSRRRNR